MVLLALLALVAGMGLLVAGYVTKSSMMKKWGIALLCAAPVILVVMALGFL